MSDGLAAQERDAKRKGHKLLDGFKDAADDFGDGLKNAGDRLTGRTVWHSEADLRLLAAWNKRLCSSCFRTLELG